MISHASLSFLFSDFQVLTATVLALVWCSILLLSFTSGLANVALLLGMILGVIDILGVLALTIGAFPGLYGLCFNLARVLIDGRLVYVAYKLYFGGAAQRTEVVRK